MAREDGRASVAPEEWPTGRIIGASVFLGPLLMYMWLSLTAGLRPPGLRTGIDRCSVSYLGGLGLIDALFGIVLCYGVPFVLSGVPVTLLAWGGARLLRELRWRGYSPVAIYAASSGYGLLTGGILTYAFESFWFQSDADVLRWFAAAGAGTGLTLGVSAAFDVLRVPEPARLGPRR